MSEMARGPRGMIKVIIEDGSGHLSWVWFNRPYLRKELQNGRWVLLHDDPARDQMGKTGGGPGGDV